MNGWNHASSYKASRIFILDKKNKYPSIKYFVDIHRDSVSKESTTTNINGKDYAKILFVVGLEHDNYKSNLEIAERINNISNKYYPGLSKGILKKEGEGVEVRLFLLQGFWENMLHLSGLTVMSLYLMSYELKDDSVIFQPCFSCAL